MVWISASQPLAAAALWIGVFSPYSEWFGSCISPMRCLWIPDSLLKLPRDSLLGSADLHGRFHPPFAGNLDQIESSGHHGLFNGIVAQTQICQPVYLLWLSRTSSGPAFLPTKAQSYSRGGLMGNSCSSFQTWLQYHSSVKPPLLLHSPAALGPHLIMALITRQ